MVGLFVFMVGAAGYSLVEVLWRGYTHWTMSVTGGLCMLFLYQLNYRIDGVFLKCLCGAAVITATELMAGLVLNCMLGWEIWDYSELPLNFKGQICLLYSVLWFILCFPIFKVCDYLQIAIERF